MRFLVPVKDNEPTLSEMEAQFGTKSVFQVFKGLLLAEDHNDLVRVVEKAIDTQTTKLIENRHLKHKRSEDELTIDIVVGLQSSGLDAEHDTQIGGHCDIVVRAKYDFLWLAEAKKHDAYGWLEKGFRQLSTRYSTGLVGQDCGEVLIYCRTRNAKKVLETWKQALQKANPDVSIIEDISPQLIFRTEHVHENTGLPFKIRHKIVPLYFSPKA